MILRRPPCLLSPSSRTTPRRPSRRRRNRHSLHRRRLRRTVGPLSLLPPRRLPIAAAHLRPSPPPPPLPPRRAKPARRTALRATRGHTQAPVHQQLCRRRRNAAGLLKLFQLSLKSLCRQFNPTTDLCPPLTSRHCPLRDAKFLRTTTRTARDSRGSASTRRWWFTPARRRPTCPG